MTNLEKLEARIKELVPDIMELKMGCRFIDLDSTQTMIYMYEEKSGAVCAFSETLGNDFYSDDYKFEDTDKIQILGRPINLEDVLMAERWLRINSFEPQDVQMQKENWEERMRNISFIIDNWIQGKSLSEQTEKVIETINNILKKIFEV